MQSGVARQSMRLLETNEVSSCKLEKLSGGTVLSVYYIADKLTSKYVSVFHISPQQRSAIDNNLCLNVPSFLYNKK